MTGTDGKYSVTIGVEHRAGTSPVGSGVGSLALDEDGVAFADGSGQTREWAWGEVRLEFDPPGVPGERGLVAALMGAVGFSTSKSNVPALRLTAPDTTEEFELPNVEGDLGVVAARIGRQFPAAVGRISVRDRQVTP